MLSTLVLTACGEGFQNSEGGYTIEVLPAQTEEGGYIIELLPAQTKIQLLKIQLLKIQLLKN